MKILRFKLIIHPTTPLFSKSTRAWSLKSNVQVLQYYCSISGRAWDRKWVRVNNRWEPSVSLARPGLFYGSTCVVYGSALWVGKGREMGTRKVWGENWIPNFYGDSCKKLIFHDKAFSFYAGGRYLKYFSELRQFHSEFRSRGI